MDNQKWDEVKKLFNRALDRNEKKRIEWLKKECDGNEELYNEVLKLLQARQYKSPVDNPLNKLPDTIFTSEGGDELNREVGNYRLIDVIGYGGMGVVYLAERTDGEFEHKVALKFLRFGMTGNKLIRRFKQERQILAKLRHPNIAKLFDGGVMADGTPWFSMEYIEGLPVTDYAIKHKLSFDERLQLFQKICNAVHYAHQNLIIHRDLKPSNIMVTEDGEPILLDFGLARMEEEESAGNEVLTLSSQNWMTLEYAAPEQVRGEKLTTVTDIYQLGLVLHELLTGRRPYSVKGSTPSEAEKIICETDVARPSTQIFDPSEQLNLVPDLNPDHLRKRLKGDLDTILLKSLNKNPGKRYSSVERLADDIQRHQEGRPILARPATLSYRAGKFIRRHHKILAAACLLIVALSFLNAHYTSQLAEERDIAHNEAERAEVVKGFMVDMVTTANPFEAPGEPITVRALLEQSADDIIEKFDNQPDIAFELLFTIGKAQNQLGEREQARITFQKGLQLFENRNLDLEPIDIANLKMHLSSTYLGDSGRKYELLNRAYELVEDNPDVPLLKAGISRSLAYIAYVRGENEKSANLVRTSINNACSEFGVGLNPRWCTGSLNDGYFFLKAAGYYEEAFEAAERNYTITNENFTQKGHPDRTTAGRLLAESLIDQNRPIEAIEIIKENILEVEKYSGTDDRRMLGLLTTLGSAESERGNDWQAIEYWKQVLERVADLPPDAFNRSIQLNLMIDSMLNLERVEEAKQAFQTYTPGDEYLTHQTRWGHRYNEVRWDLISGRPDQNAHQRWLEINETFEENYDVMLPNLKVYALDNAIDRQNIDSARYWYEKILNMDNFTPHEDSEALLVLSRYRLAENDLPNAEELTYKAKNLFESREELQGPRLARLHAIRAEIFCRNNSKESGVSELQKAETEWFNSNGHRNGISTLRNYAKTCLSD